MTQRRTRVGIGGSSSVPSGRNAHAHATVARRRRPPIRAFVELALARALNRATALAVDYLTETRSRVAVYTDLFDAAQRYVDDRWHVGYATTQDEFRVYRAIEVAMPALPEPLARPMYAVPPRALLLTLRPEEHDLGLRLVAAALSDEGWKVDLALRVPREGIAAKVMRYHPDLVAISSTYVAGRMRVDLAGAVADLRAARLPVMVGGSAFVRYPALGEFVNADIVVGDARLAVRLAGRLVQLHQRRPVRQDARKVS